ncbi:putative RING finger domain protein [Aspergillus affinis]|uniref:putative RING finger domain protein n=1 Tax=Aspergillus affinis TaxID=1070780 RepID=UPI0022FF3731|nr:uncharacterized protein KD926_001921 [Aspergillus affinis]KAI9044098.1 hypothetical protein KD926_001921 [Aspergillus affinis]
MDAGDRMFCHSCGGVWLRNERGLTCPTCHSEFTEIIEIPPDTEAPDPPEEAPEDRFTPPVNSFANHNPWASTGVDDFQDRFSGGNRGTGNDSGNGFSHRTYRSPDGRFTFSSTTYSSGLPRRSTDPQGNMQNDPLMPMVRGLDTIFHGLANTYQQTDPHRPAGQQPWGGRQRPWHLHDEDANEHDFGGWGQGPRPAGLGGQGRAPGMTHDGSFDHGLRFGGGSNFHDDELHPRDADGPQPMPTPLRSLGECVFPFPYELHVANCGSILELFRTDFGANNQAGNGGFRVMTGPNPLAMLSALLNVERHGDAVYSQEELDRVISELVDRNGNHTAAPPASQNAIRSLPKKKVDREMLGNDGKAECSICMDPVEMGTEVTVLPCKHWFHYGCIEMWLNQHNTCPHCRRGIDAPPPAQTERNEGTSDNPVLIDSSPETSRRGSAVPEHSGQPTGWSWNSAEGETERQSSRDQGTGGGGLAGWVRSRFGGGN